MMGRFESNALGPRHLNPLRDSRDPDGRLVGSFAAIKFAINVSFKKLRSDSFRKAFTPRTILLFQKMRGWLSAQRATRRHLEPRLIGSGHAGWQQVETVWRQSEGYQRLRRERSVF